jgi:hypothetical protein
MMGTKNCHTKDLVEIICFLLQGHLLKVQMFQGIAEHSLQANMSLLTHP